MRNQTTSGEHSRTIILVIIAVLCLSTAAKAKYSGGTGGLNDPYLIATAEDMNAIGANPADWDKHFLLVSDVNLADYTGTKFKIIGNSTKGFTGVFDGNDHKVWNFTWDSKWYKLYRSVWVCGPRRTDKKSRDGKCRCECCKWT